MRTGLYSERIRRIIEDFPVGEPFTNESIAGILKKEFELTSENAELITNNKLKRMFDEGKLGRIEKGVYYVPKQTVFGPVKPDFDRYTVKMLTPELSNALISRSGFTLRLAQSEAHLMYNFFLNHLYMSSIHECNDMLVAKNLPVMTGTE